MGIAALEAFHIVLAFFLPLFFLSPSGQTSQATYVPRVIQKQLPPP